MREIPWTMSDMPTPASALRATMHPPKREVREMDLWGSPIYRLCELHYGQWRAIPEQLDFSDRATAEAVLARLPESQQF